ncbi:SGNH/GDSL hydrolase family protein [Robiginitalea aurantiaca]|uniref:SGNH/GDSL hydrolase family protein n=1 Tax=Robiginitalea aurantiaca TaxID=3056915 RepID=A0ABT7WC67_9FLAO|nr:SGNH/GDSL hydrolase family protein [Robiginitalea aurantiaca]MDM9630506.1 SGNH/GDSL hydrolase family protein [Robiginitalea aurantiaca]
MKKSLAIMAFLGLFISSCSNDDSPSDPGGEIPTNPIEYTSGSADLSNFVSVGNSLAAGVSDQALFIEGQEASFPLMMASSFSEAGGGDFTIPFMSDNLGGLNIGGQQRFPNRLILDFTTGSPTPTPVSGTPTTEATSVIGGPFNNMAVPGAKSYHLLANGYGNAAGLEAGLANPYYVRFASSPSASVLGDALAQNPTFFSLWIGSNDALFYAISGGSGTDQTGNLDPSTYGSNDISDPLVLASAYNTILERLTANGAKGVIANIPDISQIPYFTTVPFNPLDPTNPAFGPQIPALNDQFAALNNVFAFLGVPERSIVFSTDAASALVIKDESLTNLSNEITATLIGGGLDAPTATVLGLQYGQARQANENDRIVFPSQTVIAELNEENFAFLQSIGVPPQTAGQLSVNGITFPLEDQWVLTPDEQDAVTTAVDAYNQNISALAQLYDLAFVDMKAFYNLVETEGIPLSDGSVVTDVYATGGGFSLDGIHPSPRGYALVANEFIKAIEEKYGAVLPKVEPLDYKGLYIN